MYASYRTVANAQGWDAEKKNASRRNRLAHKGMMKTHVQVTPDGKIIQHYKMDSRTAEFKKAIEKAYAEHQAKESEKEIVDAVNE